MTHLLAGGITLALLLAAGGAWLMHQDDGWEILRVFALAIVILVAFVGGGTAVLTGLGQMGLL